MIPTSTTAPASSSPSDRPSEPAGIEGPDVVEEILATARTQIGMIYQWGGSTPEDGFDCSGFVQWVFAQHGYKLPRSTKQQISKGKRVTASRLKPGDLVFFARKSGSGSPHHVGIYEGHGSFIHSPRTGKRIQSSAVFGPYFGARFLGGRRIVTVSSAAGNVPQAGDAVSESPKRLRVYTVRPGDYIWKIARKLGVSPRDLLQLNNLSTEDVIKAGQRLLIPPK